MPKMILTGLFVRSRKKAARSYQQLGRADRRITTKEN
jgi:hypothetical protein